MTNRIENDGVRSMRDSGAQIVEVLPESAYEQLHIAGAINIPLTDLDRESADQLDRNKPVIFYCYDHQ